MYDYGQCTSRWIICVDLKSFFASVSCLSKGLNPMKTKLAVVADTKRQGSVVLAATPPLKALGIKTGSRLYEIPMRNDIFIINPSMMRYIQVSNRISSIALQYVAPEDFHQYSIDEFFMDMTASLHLFADSIYEFSSQLQKEIMSATGIINTIGIGPNPLLAKLSMDFEAKKTQQGIAEWHYYDIPEKLWDVSPLSKMWGINRRTEAKLNKKGIFTIGDLAHYPVPYLKRDFGIIGVDLHLHANGTDESLISEKYSIKDKSLGKSQILMRDYQKNELKVILSEQIDEVFFRVREQDKYPKTVSVTVGYADAGGIRKQFTHPSGYMSTLQIIQEMWNYLYDRLEDDRLYRTIGISFTKLVSNQIKQLNLFEDPKEIKSEIIDHHLDDIRRKYGKDTVLRASSLTASGSVLQRKNLVAGHKG